MFGAMPGCGGGGGGGGSGGGCVADASVDGGGAGSWPAYDSSKGSVDRPAPNVIGTPGRKRQAESVIKLFAVQKSWPSVATRIQYEIEEQTGA